LLQSTLVHQAGIGHGKWILPLIIVSDDRHRFRRNTPQQICNKNYENLTAPPCLGEALRRGALKKLQGLMIFMVRV